MVFHAKDKALQRAAMETLYDMLYPCGNSSLDLATGMLEDNGLHILLQLMGTHLDCINVQRAGIRAILVMAGTKDVRVKEALIRTGCVRSIVQAMNAHADTIDDLESEDTFYEDLNSRGCIALSKLMCAELSDSVKSMIVDIGLVDVIIRTIKTRSELVLPSDERVDLCQCLLSVILKHTDNFQAVGLLVLEVVLYTLQHCENFVKHHACHTLMCILKMAHGTKDEGSYQEALRHSGGVQVLQMCLLICETGFQEAYGGLDRAGKAREQLGMLLGNLDSAGKTRGKMDKMLGELDSGAKKREEFEKLLGKLKIDSDSLEGGSTQTESSSSLETNTQGNIHASSVVAAAVQPGHDTKDSMFALVVLRCVYYAAHAHTQNQNMCSGAFMQGVMRVMAKYAHSSRVQAAGCHALHALCHGNCANTDVLARHGGDAYIQCAMQMPYKHDFDDEKEARLYVQHGLCTSWHALGNERSGSEQ
jgi:hypothetical protein